MPGSFREEHTLRAVINPQTIAANGNATSGWVKADSNEICAYVLIGSTDAAVGTKLMQATDASGTGAKDITGKIATQLSATDDNKQIKLCVRADELDINNGFGYVAVRIETGAGVTGAVAAAVVLSGHMRHQPADDYKAATLVQVVY